MIVYPNYLRVEKRIIKKWNGEHIDLQFVCKCENCGKEYMVNNAAIQKNGYCNDCKKILAEERSKQIKDNHKKKAYEAIKKDLKRLIEDVSKKRTMQIDGECYIKRSDVTEAINNYFSK